MEDARGTSRRFGKPGRRPASRCLWLQCQGAVRGQCVRDALWFPVTEGQTGKARATRGWQAPWPSTLRSVTSSGFLRSTCPSPPTPGRGAWATPRKRAKRLLFRSRHAPAGLSAPGEGLPDKPRPLRKRSSVSARSAELHGSLSFSLKPQSTYRGSCPGRGSACRSQILSRPVLREGRGVRPRGAQPRDTRPRGAGGDGGSQSGCRVAPVCAGRRGQAPGGAQFTTS